MSGQNFNEVVELITRDDSRYDPAAYTFMRHALDYTLKNIQNRESGTQARHVSGQELSEGIRDFALQQYGPMALTLLNNWGIYKTGDFGNIVFNLVEYGVFGKTEHDRQEDFNQVYDFREAFEVPFLPEDRKESVLAEIRQEPPNE